MSTLVTKPAPGFKAKAAMPGENGPQAFDFDAYRKDKYAILFFYPLDFTFVCPTEIIAFDHKLAEFTSRECVVAGVSVDSHWTHLAWKRTPVAEGGIGDIQYPLVADLTKNIARDYGVLLNDALALRGLFLIDKKGIVRHAVVNDLPLGRNVDEALRMVDALRHHEQFGEVCPAGWSKGKAAMKEGTDGVANYLREHGKAL